MWRIFSLLGKDFKKMRVTVGLDSIPNEELIGKSAERVFIFRYQLSEPDLFVRFLKFGWLLVGTEGPVADCFVWNRGQARKRRNTERQWTFYCCLLGQRKVRDWSSSWWASWVKKAAEPPYLYPPPSPLSRVRVCWMRYLPLGILCERKLVSFYCQGNSLIGNQLNS